VFRSRARLSRWFAFAAITLAIAALTLNRLGAADVCGANEAVEGVFVQQMVEHGALLFPLENGRAPMYKPPLFHWTATALDRIGGVRQVTAFNLRLPSALYATAGVVLTMAFATSILGPGGGALAGLLLAASYQYVSQGRIGRVDMTLCFFETLALFVFMWWYAPDGLGLSSRASDTENAGARSRGWLLYLLAIAMGLGVLAKGPVGALIPGVAIVIFLAAERQWRVFRRLLAPGPLIVGSGIAVSWYLACFFGHRYGFLDRQLGSENFGRFLGSLGSMKPWYYVVPLLLNSAPISIFMPLAILAALRTYWCPGPPLFAAQKAGSDDYINGRARSAVRLFAIFWIVTVVFFSVAAYKRRAYLLPLWPTAAVVMAWWLQALARRYWGRIVRGAAVAISAALIVGFFIFLPRREIHECGHDSFRAAASHINRVVGRNEPLYIYGLFDEPAPLLFYLDRSAPQIRGKLGDAPPGYVIVPIQVWNRRKDEALDLTPIYRSNSGKPPVILLRHGRAYAAK
jgi:4-amino-4-deoxy-L-arabinose transferase-like glycosyltransferase